MTLVAMTHVHVARETPAPAGNSPRRRRVISALFLLQLLACASPAPSPQNAAPGRAGARAEATAWWRDDVFYEIYPRSFADSNGDGTGDLRGITEHLDDLRALGVDAIWLTPIHPTPSEHGYDVLDYEGVAADLGTIADVEALTAAAHTRGMHVVLDFVLNHSSLAHPWFRAHSDYYVWRDAPDDRWHRPWDNTSVWHRDEATGRHYLGLFWSGMPDLNLANPAVVDAMTHAMRFWLEHGVDGFRIDAARHLVEVDEGERVQMTDTAATHDVVQRIRTDLHRTHPNAILVAEAWASTSEIAAYSKEFDLVFSFGVAGGLVDALTLQERAPLVEALQGAEAAFRGERQHEAPFLTNHDMVRVMRQLDGDGARARLGAATLLALPGTPFLYYGEEVGMQGLEGRDDAFKRTKLDWRDVDAQRNDPTSLWRTYQRAIALRRAHVALHSGDAVRPDMHGGGRGAFALLRTRGSERVVFVANFAKETARDFTVAVNGAPTLLVADGVDGVRSHGGALHVDVMAPHAFALIALAANR